MIRARIALAALAYAALVAHLLFIPYAYSPLPLDEALRRFPAIPWLHLGSDQNVALVSRALMFLPLGVLLAAWVAPRPRRQIEFPALLVAGLFGCAWAVVVNFAQLWFPTRTVSVNNLAAECLGVMIGGLLWSTLGTAGLRWQQELASGGRITLKAALNGYVVMYLLGSLMPFDFAIGGDQLAQKAASGLYGLWIAPVGCGPAPCAMKFASVMVATIPCGWWFAVRRPGARNAWIPALMVAFIVATIIELLHFLMVSGMSQGASVFVRVVGMVLGVATYSWRHHLAALDLNRVGRPVVLAMLVPYLVVVAYLAGWFRAPKLSVAAGLARLDSVIWLPFHYQYYSPYTSTMTSTIVHVALYAPVGVACWLWSRHRDRIALWPAALFAVLLAFLAETSKVFLAGRLPDYTDVFIAGVSATLALAVLRFASRSQHPPREAIANAQSVAARQPWIAGRHDASTGSLTPATAPAAPSAPNAADAASAPRAIDAARAPSGARLVGALLLLMVAVTVIGFPTWPWVVAPGLVLYAALLLRFPATAYLIAIPLLLPVLDLAPFSGRFFWDEFDLLLATTLGVRLLLPQPMRQTEVPMPKAALWLLLVSVAVSMAIGAWPLAPVDANAFSGYWSTYNALRVAKGYVWSGAMLWLIWRDASADRKVVPTLQLGLGLSLFAATISVFWERLQFLGWPDLGIAFRAAGFVSATHVGGAYLEAMLVMLAPFALALAVTAERFLRRLMWYVVVLLGAGAVYMTLSRAALMAWGITVAVFAGVWSVKSMGSRAVLHEVRWRWGTGIAFVGLVFVTLLVAQSSYVRERLATSRSDFTLRVSHWGEAIDLIQLDALHVVFGMGLGSFPREFYLAHASTHQLPAYRLERDAGSELRYLVLTGGRGMYMDQRVAARPGSELGLTGQIRSPQARGRLSLSLCAKTFLNSVACDEVTVSSGPTWQPFVVRLSSPQRAETSFAPNAPVSLSLHNGAFGSRVEVTQLSLRDGQTELLRNGSFERGLDRWLVASDVHLAWRVLNTPLQIAFEQGALGILAWLVLFGTAIAVVLRPSASPAMTAAFAAAGTAFFVVGCFDSLLDSPRVILLLALVGAVGLSTNHDFSSGAFLRVRPPAKS